MELGVKQQVIYTDGSANNKILKEKRIAGYSAIFISKKRKNWLEFSGADLGMNSYEAELMAVILACYKALELGYKNLKIISDNKSITDAYNKGWIVNWRFECFSGRDKKWILLEEIIQSGNLTLEWEWVKGHSGVEANELADKIANKARNTFKIEN